MNFGSVQVGSSTTRTLTISNTGNSTLNVTLVSYPSGFSGNWGSGSISAGGSQAVTVTFVPTAATTYGGTITVNSDKTSGTNTISCSGTGTEGQITATITFQGGNRPLGGMSVPLTLKLYDSSKTLTSANILTETAIQTFTTAAGQLTITGTNVTAKTVTFTTPVVTPGTYHITVASPHNLINMKTNVVVGKGTTPNMGTLLEGNANDDEQIAGADFSMLLNDYLATSASPPAKWNNGRCDFDRDGQVTSVDFSLLSVNYNVTSPHTIA